METPICEDDWFAEERAAEPETRVLLVDQDPISRHVLGGVVRRADRLRLVASVDVRQPMNDWRLEQTDIAVLGVGHACDPVEAIRELTARGIRVLLIGVGWTERKLDAVFRAGAKGCLLKDARISGLAAAARAVASGHTVLSPELHELWRAPAGGGREAPPGRSRPPVAGPSAGRSLDSLTDREREVLVLLADGLSTAEAAARLHVSSATIKSHVSHTLTKLGVRNRLEAVLLMQGADPSAGAVAQPS